MGEVDLVVVGFGGAGAAAAITAHDAGARVVVCEKQAADAHTPSTRMSGGLVMAVDDAEKGAAYLDACAGGMVPTEVTRAWAESAAGVLDWLRTTAGLTFSRINTAEHPELPGADAIGVHQPGEAAFRLDPSAGGGDALFTAVASAVHERGIDVRWATPVRRLIVEDGRVVGVTTDSGPIRARKGVILSCGGYEFDEELKRDNLRAYPVHFYGNPGNTGDGVRMAQAAGAGLWHMNTMIGRAIGHFPLESAEGGWLNFIIDINPPGHVIVDRGGQRYANETMQAQLLHGFYYEMLRYDYDRATYSRIPSWWVFDERRRTAGPLTLSHIGAVKVGLYDWSPDNSAEIERGWIARGNTPEEAAAAAGMEDPEALARTVAEYNAACAAGVDPFGRAPETLIPLDSPPYYVVPLYPGGSNTCGGPRRDAAGRVLDPYDEPIPGLYAAGELGQPVGMLYPADGANLSEAFCFGRIAALTAVGA
ncbi:FAD-dependent oxidoreductase [Pseudonocardia thermophila]|jgi:Succinate dehydrogenase/fumarate reductase, flavoprotein subunit|uniref:FAD-dependent oxidoreductase n=1 Tax=Pseudonocardia thermophila TaxID=1848 RepID=UPI00248DDBA5|nr:FAD-dependent oxidoreductase [Pseudonocardia thermophila]